MATIIEDEFDDLTMVSAVTAAISGGEETKTHVIIDDEFDDLTAVSATGDEKTATGEDLVGFVKTTSLPCTFAQARDLVKWGAATWTGSPFTTTKESRTMGEIGEAFKAEFDSPTANGYEYGFVSFPGLPDATVKALKSRLIVRPKADGTCTVSESFNSAIDSETYEKVAKLAFVQKSAEKS